MWKNININRQNIEAQTAKAVLFKMPHKSRYDGFVFWHSAKLVRDGRHSNAVSIGYTDDFKFKLRKYGNGRYNGNKCIDEKEITAAEFEEAFGVMDENISAPEFKNPYETHKPQEVEAVETKADESLVDDE